MIRRIASSPAATVARPGIATHPAGVAAQCRCRRGPSGDCTAARFRPWSITRPRSVTVSTLMQDLSGGRMPLRLPRPLAGLVVRAAKALGRVHEPTAANARRVELLWLGQPQAESWLTATGWQVPVGREGWRPWPRGTSSEDRDHGWIRLPRVAHRLSAARLAPD